MNNRLTFMQFYNACQSYFSCRWLVEPLTPHQQFAFVDENTSLISFPTTQCKPAILVSNNIDDLYQMDTTDTQLGILTGDHKTSEPLFFLNSIPILTTTTPSCVVIETLLPYLQKNLRRPASLHGVMLDVFGKGIFLMGPSGIGKSECAKALLSRGHRLISDDITCFYRTKSNQIVGFAPNQLENLLELRGLGAIDVREWHGPCSVIKEKNLELVITLYKDQTLSSPRPIKKQLGEKIILDISVPQIAVNLAFKQDLAMLIESAVQFAFSSSTTVIENLLTFPLITSTESLS